jgi:hypothetical protein
MSLEATHVPGVGLGKPQVASHGRAVTCTVAQKNPVGQSPSPPQKFFVQYASMSPFVPMHVKSFAASQSGVPGPFGQCDPNCPGARGNESFWQTLTSLPSTSLTVPVQLPAEIHWPGPLHVTQSSWTSHVKVQVPPTQRTPLFSSQSLLAPHGFSEITPDDDPPPVQYVPRLPESETRAVHV